MRFPEMPVVVWADMMKCGRPTNNETDEYATLLSHVLHKRPKNAVGVIIAPFLVSANQQGYRGQLRTPPVMLYHLDPSGEFCCFWIVVMQSCIAFRNHINMSGSYGVLILWGSTCSGPPWVSLDSWQGLGGQDGCEVFAKWINFYSLCSTPGKTTSPHPVRWLDCYVTSLDLSQLVNCFLCI